MDGEEEEEEEAPIDAGLLVFALTADEDDENNADDAFIAAAEALLDAAAMDEFVSVNKRGGIGSYIRREFCSYITSLNKIGS